MIVCIKVFVWLITIGPIMVGWCPLILSTTFKLRYDVTVTLNLPRLKVGSAPKIENSEGSVQNVDKSSSCQSKPKIHRSSGAPVTSQINGTSSWLICWRLHCSSNMTSESVLFADVCPRLAYLACVRFRGRSLIEDAFKIPPFFLWTLWYATFGVLTEA